MLLNEYEKRVFCNVDRLAFKAQLLQPHSVEQLDCGVELLMSRPQCLNI